MPYVVRSSNAPGAIVGFSDTPPPPPPDQPPAIVDPLPPEARASQAALFAGAADAPAPGTAARSPHTWRHTLALVSAAAIIALSLFALVRGLQVQSRPLAPAVAPLAPSPVPTAPAPTATPRTIPAYWSPGGAAVPAPIYAAPAYHFIGRLGDSWVQVRLPGGGEVWVRLADLPLDQLDMEALAAVPDRATPTPAPTPIVIVQQAPPVQCWTVTLDVADEHGYPIGVATGESCLSRDAAQANADVEAAQIKAAHEKR